MRLSDKHTEEFNFETEFVDFQSATNIKIEKMVDREHCGLFRLTKNKQLVSIMCKSELEVFLFSFYLTSPGS